MHTWISFFTVALIATMLPGPAMLLIATHSLRYGWKRTIITILGNVSGLAILSLLSVLGLSAIIVSSNFSFLIVKIIGAAYLFYLGFKIWRNGIKPITATIKPDQQKANNLYFQGIFLALSNPKAILFTTALFPQFINLNESIPVQFFVLVSTLCTLSFLSLLVCAIISRSSFSFVGNSHIGAAISKLFGGAFMGLSAWLVATVKSAG